MLEKYTSSVLIVTVQISVTVPRQNRRSAKKLSSENVTYRLVSNLVCLSYLWLQCESNFREFLYPKRTPTGNTVILLQTTTKIMISAMPKFVSAQRVESTTFGRSAKCGT